MRKLLCVILSVSVLLSFPIAHVSADATVSDEVCDIVASFEVLPSDDYRSDNKWVTRAEMAYVTAFLSGINSDEIAQPGEVFYSDVPAEHPFAGYINAMSRLGFIKGFSDGMFEPDYKITHTDAAFSLISTLGLQAEAEAWGGYPNGYLMLAAKHGLFKDLTGPYITQREMNLIVLRAVYAKGVRPKHFINGELFYDSDNVFTIIEDVLHFSKIEGIVVKNAFSSLSEGENVGKGYVQIGDGLFRTGSSRAEDWLGYNVTAYVKHYENDIPMVVYIAPRYDSVRVYDVDISKETNAKSVISYKNGRTVRYRLSKDVEYIYNGKLERGLSKSDICIDSGWLDLIDNNDDGVYDIVKITRYDNYFVDAISAEKEYITDAYGKTLDLDNTDYTLYSNGEIVGLDTAKSHDVLSAAISKDGEYAIIHITSDVVVGEITKTDEVDNSYLIAFDSYNMAASYLTAVDDDKARAPHMGLVGSFYLDVRGRIAGYSEEVEESPESYGYLFAVGRTNSSLDSNLLFKIYTADGEFQIFSSAKTITVDGKSYKSLEKNNLINDIKLDDGSVRQLIRYRLNERAELKVLDTSKVNEQYGESVENSLSRCTKGNSNEEFIWENSNNVQGAFFISPKTSLFVVPTGESADDETLYSTSKGSAYFRYARGYYAEGYDTEIDYIARAVVVLLKDTDTGGGSYFVVDEISSILDEETEEETKKITAHDGSEYIAKDPTVFDGLERGDVVEVGQDARQRVTGVSVILDVSNSPIPTTSFGTEWDSPHVYRAERRWTVMVVLDRKGDIFDGALLDSNGNIDESTRFLYQWSPMKPIVYDSASDRVYIGDATDLDEALYSNNPNSRVLVRQNYSTMALVYVYK